ncbi:MAG: hypothetical protein AAGG51_27765 [Cyanobacteria bacterium P01_G01_bin.54]
MAHPRSGLGATVGGQGNGEEFLTVENCGNCQLPIDGLDEVTNTFDEELALAVAELAVGLEAFDPAKKGSDF